MNPQGVCLLLLAMLCVGCAPPLPTFAGAVLAAEPHAISVAGTLWKVAAGASDKDLLEKLRKVERGT
ncbi:hypothetical protein [Corallococcus sp. CA047B]|uniref:hypothetical protein n=1 Tax=Corallococcus sp. CA047B TaxID=2316729 RepID=UPI0011C47435|nr:hypothetical protein [Corallococcus sp. CA047B]